MGQRHPSSHSNRNRHHSTYCCLIAWVSSCRSVHSWLTIRSRSVRCTSSMTLSARTRCLKEYHATEQEQTEKNTGQRPQPALQTGTHALHIHIHWGIDGVVSGWQMSEPLSLMYSRQALRRSVDEAGMGQSGLECLNLISPHPGLANHMSVPNWHGSAIAQYAMLHYIHSTTDTNQPTSNRPP